MEFNQKTMAEFRDKYLIKDKIGEGTYGNVYTAVDKTTDTFVVLKIMDDLKSVENEITHLLFLQKYCHDCFICIKEYFSLAGGETEYVIVEEYIEDGVDLRMVLIEHREYDRVLSESEFIKIIENMIKCIKKLHTYGIIHGDVKEANIIVNTKTYDIKLIDFGLSCNYENCKQFVQSYMPFKFREAYERYSISGDAEKEFQKFTPEDYISSDIYALGKTILFIFRTIKSKTIKNIGDFLSDNPTPESVDHALEIIENFFK